MLHKIAALSQEVIAQVAAGEVIERPSSVIKELLENAIDADTHMIDIYLEAGGKKYIRVDDHGKGMNPEDLQLALLPHTTSKIHTIDDIQNIQTLGFRGEALASIAHVSELTLISRQADDSCYQICSFGEHAFQLQPATLRAKTSVRVHHLYYNVPARKKFLKTDQTEYSHCLDLTKKIALAYPHIAFHLSHNQKNIFHYEKTCQDNRITQVLGDEFIEQTLFINESTEDMHLKAYVSHPHATEHLRNIHYCYVNNRLVKDKIITSALKEAYRDVIHLDKDMSYVLFLSLSPDVLDVNVHPTKTEVRFQKPSLIYQFVKQHIQKALSLKPSLSSIHHHTVPQVQTAITDHLKRVDQELSFQPISHYLALDHHKKHIAPSPHNSSTPQQQRHTTSPLVISNTENPKVDTIPHQTSMDSTLDTAQDALLGQALAQLHGIYILAENKTGLILVDMHAAHERILYEQYKKAFALKNIQQQTLISPILINVTPEEEEAISQHMDMLIELGFSISLIGHQKIAIRSIPILLIRYPIEPIITSIIENLISFNETSYTEQLYHAILSKIACHKAYRAHDHMSIADMNTLLRQLEETTRGGQCNHGRPTYFHISIEKLDQLFMRGK